MAVGIVKFLLVGILAVLAHRAFLFVKYQKYGDVVFNHQPGPCRLIKGVEYGSEDMQVLPNGMLFISGGLRFMKDVTISPWKDIQGELLLYNVNTPDKPAMRLRIEGDVNMKLFNPHGISIWTDKVTGAITLFVINHLPTVDVIELFSFNVNKPTVLVHMETISNDAIVFPNDIVAVGPRQFYLTNYSRFKRGFLVKVEAYLSLPLSSVMYYDGTEGRQVVTGLFKANGINASPDGKYVYLANRGDGTIDVYDKAADGSLTLKQVVNVGAADNIDVDVTTGDLWVVIHTRPDLIPYYHGNPQFPLPAKVIQLKTRSGLVVSMHEVYAEAGDDGQLVTGTSVAVRYQDKLLLGTIGQRAAVCDILYRQ